MARTRKKPVVGDITRGGDIPRTFKTATPDFNHKRMESMIPMRDGVKLFTVISIPNGTGTMPIILTRTPYNAAKRSSRTDSPDIAMAMHAVDEVFVRDGYIRVYQDVRGRYGSQGKSTMTMPTLGPYNSGDVDHVTETWDTIAWLVDNVPGASGRVGIIGTSYEGLVTLMALLDPHPALKAAVPINSMVDSWVGDDFYHHGAFRIIMLVCIALIPLYSLFLKNTALAAFKPVFWLESLMLWAFGISWATKGEMLWKDAHSTTL